VSTGETSFQAAFRVVVGEEGGYSSNRSDPGNWTGGVVGVGVLGGTKYGISARSFPTLDIAGLTLDQARGIYRVKYWNRIAGDALPSALALLLFDEAVNQGVGAASLDLQRPFPQLVRDGVVGVATVAAACGAPLAGLLGDVAVERALRYAADPDVRTFGGGWFARLLRVLSIAQSSLGDTHA
jgi:lysozyme family protein